MAFSLRRGSMVPLLFFESDEYPLGDLCGGSSTAGGSYFQRRVLFRTEQLQNLFPRAFQSGVHHINLIDLCGEFASASSRNVAAACPPIRETCASA
jgi:hypothetical protein